MELSQRLRELRRGLGMTLLDVKQRTGVSVSHLSDIERGRTRPSLETLTALARCYGVSMADLMAGVDSEEASAPAQVPGLRELVEKQEIPEEWAELLSRIEWRGRRPRSENEWMMLYMFLRNLLDRDNRGKP